MCINQCMAKDYNCINKTSVQIWKIFFSFDDILKKIMSWVASRTHSISCSFVLIVIKRLTLELWL